MYNSFKVTALLVILIMPIFGALAEENKKNAYDFSFNYLRKKEILSLADYKGKVLLVVNTASKCGFTPQYEGLEELYKKYKDQGLVVIGVPSNDFGEQEPGTAEDIEKFCRLNYGVTFPMTAKETVSGEGAHPFYLWARETLGFGTAPKWNFHKYLISRSGTVVDYFNSTTSPSSSKLIEAIELQLAKGT